MSLVKRAKTQCVSEDTTSKTIGILDIPIEVLCIVAAFCDFFELNRFCITCKTLKNIRTDLFRYQRNLPPLIRRVNGTPVPIDINIFLRDNLLSTQFNLPSVWEAFIIRDGLHIVPHYLDRVARACPNFAGYPYTKDTKEKDKRNFIYYLISQDEAGGLKHLYDMGFFDVCRLFLPTFQAESYHVAFRSGSKNVLLCLDKIFTKKSTGDKRTYLSHACWKAVMVSHTRDLPWTFLVPSGEFILWCIDHYQFNFSYVGSIKTNVVCHFLLKTLDFKTYKEKIVPRFNPFKNNNEKLELFSNILPILGTNTEEQIHQKLEWIICEVFSGKFAMNLPRTTEHMIFLKFVLQQENKKLIEHLIETQICSPKELKEIVFDSYLSNPEFESYIISLVK
jgi:hypothetical protein